MNTWCTQKRAWYPPNQNLTVPVPAGGDRGSGFTVFGCIGPVLRNGYYIEFDKSTNKWAFNNYIKNLALQIKDEYKGTLPVILLDNHGAHTNADVKNTLCQYF